MESLDVGSFVMGLMLGVVDAVAVMLLLRSRSLEKHLKCAASQVEAAPNWRPHKAPAGPPPAPAKRVEVTHLNAPPRPVKDKFSDAPPRPGSGG